MTIDKEYKYLYNTWLGMKYRCDSTKSPSYRFYGALGIKYIKRWKSFSNFCDDMGHKPSKIHTLDRINSAKGYSKSNCKWSTPLEQSNNRKGNYYYKGESSATASRRLGGYTRMVAYRISRRGMSYKEAFTTPYSNR